MINIAVLVSGSGTNLQALIDAQNAGKIPGGKITCVISSKSGVYALERAKMHNIETVVVSRSSFLIPEEFDKALVAELERRDIGLVVLAGFMCILGKRFVSAFAGRIINVHPSLIPSFCGDGYYGLRVHKAALDYGVKVTGATVHFVNEITDGGKIILQKAVDVLDGDTPETLQKRVMEEAEWQILPKAVAMFCSGEIK
ncbi:MAG TPA: phosphoribosylglycinamide formyltransferase [Ruminococcaceae bacterium]|nr:phosphoribosylglycinamide formyltransferase [Oscillospiraceae bacterium]